NATVLASRSSPFTAKLSIGSGVGSSFFSGKIDDTKIWNRALSASEITALYNAGNPTNSTGQEGNWTAFTSEYYGGNASVSNLVGKLVQYRASFNSSSANYSAFLQNVSIVSALQAYAPIVGASIIAPATIDLTPGPSNTTVFCTASVTDFNGAPDVSTSGASLYQLATASNRNDHFGPTNYSLGAFNNTQSTQSASVYGSWAASSFVSNGTFYSTPIIINRSNNNQTILTANWSWFESAGLTRDQTGSNLGNDTVVLDLHFENDTKDASRFNNSGSVANFGSGVTMVQCQVGNCFNFNGSNDANNLITIPHSATIQPPATGSMSVSAWLTNTTFLNAYAGALMKVTDSTWSDGYGLFYNAAAGGLCFFSKVYTSRACATPSATGSRYHVVGTYNTTHLTVYVNGVQQAMSAYSGGIGVNSANLVIGSGLQAGTYAWNGTIDELHVWNRSLSASEVAQLYSWEYNSTGRGNSGFINNFTNVSLAFRAKNYSFNDSGLVGWWDLGDSTDNENATGRSLDLSGNGWNAVAAKSGAGGGSLPLLVSVSGAGVCVIGNCYNVSKSGGGGFNVSNGVNAFGNISAPIDGLANWTMSAWAFVSATGGTYTLAETYGSGTLGSGWQWAITGNRYEIYFGGVPGQPQYFGAPANSFANAWALYSITAQKVNSTSFNTSWFINGVYYGSNYTGGSLPSLVPPVGMMVIGKNTNYNSEVFQGLLDDFKIWNRTLSQSEITALYNAGNPTNATGNETNWTSFTSEYYGGNASVQNVVGKIVQFRASFNSSGSSNYSAFLQNVSLTVGYPLQNNTAFNTTCSLLSPSGNAVTSNCSFSIPFNSPPGPWACTINATDSTSLTSANQSGVSTVNTLLSFTVAPSTVNFGSTLRPLDNSSVQSFNVTNWGNVKFDVKLEGTNLTGASPNFRNITFDNVYYGWGPGMHPSGETVMTLRGSGSFNTTYGLGPAANANAQANRTHFFDLHVPSGILPGTYGGYIDITAQQSGG
ncbi:hypothetical protein HY095_06210, partial [Candidatus Micrarchaeota archaeon]|nr:hypothetical protein [Candidatus Micrarchaeota archaeon]